MAPDLLAQIAAAVYLIALPGLIKQQTHFVHRLVFFIVPLLIGFLLAVQTYGRLRGWPV